MDSMRPEEKLHRAIWNTLDELKQQSLVTPKDEWTLIGCETDEKKRAAQALKNSGAIKIVGSKSKPMPLGFEAIQRLQGIEEEPIGYYVGLIEPRFTEVLNLYYTSLGETSSYVSAEVVEKLTTKLNEWQGNIIKPELSSAQVVKAEDKPPKQKIEKLTLIEPASSSSTIKVIVNEDYRECFPFDTKKTTGRLLLTLVESNEEPISHAENKDGFDYLNGNKSRLVAKTKWLPTKILESQAGHIEPIVKIEHITEAVYKNRLEKTLKNA
jgi:hypothetical protein